MAHSDAIAPYPDPLMPKNRMDQSDKTKSQQIKEELKTTLSYNQRKVSVREDPGGLSSSFTFTIRDTSVIPIDLAHYLQSLESIDRCDSSNEILSGGNTFVHLTMTIDVFTAWSEKYFNELSVISPSSDTCYSHIYHLQSGITVSLDNSPPYGYHMYHRDLNRTFRCPGVNLKGTSKNL